MRTTQTASRKPRSVAKAIERRRQAAKKQKTVSKPQTKSPVKQPKIKKDPETMEELLSQTGFQIPSLARGQSVSGSVVSVGPREILMNIGAKSEGIVAGREFDLVRDYASGLSVGDQVAAHVVIPENDLGQIVLSLRSAGEERRWKILKNAFENGENVTFSGTEVNRGGLIVDFHGLRGFLPSSQLDSKMIGQISKMVGQQLDCFVVEIDRESNRLIVSQRKQLTKVDLKNIAKKVKVGKKYSGKVIAVLPFGVYVDLSGLEGMVHISEIAWERVSDPASYFKVGSEIEAVALGIDESSGRVNLSVKQLLTDPWKEIGKKYSQAQSIASKVTRVTPYGVFVNLEPGIDGLIHISKIPPEMNVKVGDKADCTIESIDEKSRRISLSLVLKEKPVGYR